MYIRFVPLDSSSQIAGDTVLSDDYSMPINGLSIQSAAAYASAVDNIRFEV